MMRGELRNRLSQSSYRILHVEGPTLDRFKFGDELFNRVEVLRVRWQVHYLDSLLVAHLFNRFRVMERGVIITGLGDGYG